jgi:SH3 domain protein
MMLRTIFIALFCCASAFSTAQTTSNATSQGESGFVSNELFIYMRAGPSPNFRLVGTITAGTPVQMLQRDGEYVQVLDDRQRTGWIEAEFYSQSPSLQSQVSVLTDSLDLIQSTRARLEAENTALSKDLKASQEQAKQLNRELTEQLEQLSIIEQEEEQRNRTNNVQWLTRGSIIALVSVLVGFMLGAFARRNRSRNRLM